MNASPTDAPAIDADLALLQDRYRGLLYGLALGDALAAPAQHRRPGTFMRIGDLIGGGPYELPRGAWTDDAAVALLLAESLTECGELVREDAYDRLARWQTDGVGATTGQCIGITASMARELARHAAAPGTPVDAARVDREPLLRAGIAAAFELADPERAIELAADLARLTHDHPVVIDACRYAAALAVGVLRGEPRDVLLAPGYSPVPGLWQRLPLRREVAAVAAGGWQHIPEAPATLAGGDVLAALQLLLGGLARGTGYRDTVLAVVNLGLDADANGALVGQFAGALYGLSSLPAHWVADLADAGRIAAIADRLLVAALARIVAP